MAMLDSDLLLVGRGGGSFRTTAQELKTYVESGDGLVYRGAIDFTAAPVLDPNPPVVGDLYINTTAGTVNAGFTGAAGSATDVGDRILWDGTAWALVTASQDVGVISVSVTAPITDVGTPAEPSIGISDATNAAKGAVQLADNAYEADGTINTTTTATDVLTGTHFDVLAARITTAAGGGIQDVNGSNGLTASVTSGTATVTGIDATTATKGVVQLTGSIALNSTLAVTGVAVQNYAVPLDLSTLTELT